MQAPICAREDTTYYKLLYQLSSWTAYYHASHLNKSHGKMSTFGSESSPC